MRFPPVEFDDAAGAGGGEQVAMAERGDEEWVVRGGEAAQRGHFAVIAVVVAEADDVDEGEVFERESGRMHAAWTDPGDGTDARGKNWVGEEVAVGGWEEVGRVADLGGDDFVGARRGWDGGWRRIERDVRRPARGAQGELPAKEIGAAADAG